MGSLRASDVVLMSAFAEQYHSIGWLQLFLRRISKKWELAYTHYRDIPLSETYLNTWSTSFIHHVWTYTHSLWAHMNTILHGASAEENAAKILRDLQSEVNMKVRDNPHQLLPWHYGLIQDRALDELLKLPYDDIQCWLQPVQEAQKFLQYQEVQHRVAAAQHFSISSSTYSPFSDSSDYSTFLTETTVPSTASFTTFETHSQVYDNITLNTTSSIQSSSFISLRYPDQQSISSQVSDSESLSSPGSETITRHLPTEISWLT